MQEKRCCFAGHSELYDESIRDKVKETVIELIEKENVREFWVGHYGNFDKYAASVIRELKSIYPHILLELVIPYLTKSIDEYKKLYYNRYDHILIADIPAKTPKRYQIVKTNEYMVLNADFMVAYVNHGWGGAARTLKFAQRKKDITIFNLGALESVHTEK